MKELILEDYDGNFKKYNEFSEHLHHLINSLLNAHGITVHGVYIRVKDRFSLEGKINRKDKYNSIEDITDIVGIRVITYFEDTIEDIKRVFEEEFKVDTDQSVDKRVKANPTEFGYSSLHLILSLNNSRATLKEYSEYKEIKFEVQVRSLLQHAWAEIEHDIGYKNSNGLPKEVKRSFSRIASLLELADIEFGKIKSTTEEIKLDISNVENFHKTDLEIDKISLTEFYKREPLVNKMDEEIASKLSIPLQQNSNVSVENHAERFIELGIKRIDELYNFLEENQNVIVNYGVLLLGELKSKDTYRGISVFISIYILMAKKLSLEEITQHLIKHNFNNQLIKNPETIIDRYNKSKP